MCGSTDVQDSTLMLRTFALVTHSGWLQCHVSHFVSTHVPAHPQLNTPCVEFWQKLQNNHHPSRNKRITHACSSPSAAQRADHQHLPACTWLATLPARGVPPYPTEHMCCCMHGQHAPCIQTPIGSRLHCHSCTPMGHYRQQLALYCPSLDQTHSPWL